MILRKMQADYKIYMEEKKSRIIQNSQDGMYLIRYQEFNNAIVIKIVYNWHRDKQMSPWERTDKLKTDLSKYRSLICERTIITYRSLGKRRLFFSKKRKRKFMIIISHLFILLFLPELYSHHLSRQWNLSPLPQLKAISPF